MALCLQGNIPFVQYGVAVFNQFLGVGVLFVQLRFFVLHDQLAVDTMFDHAVAMDLDLEGDPLVAVIGLGFGRDTVIGHQLAIHDNVGARTAHIAGRPFGLAVASQQLRLNAYREVLVLAHGLRGLAVQHHAAVAKGPSGSSGGLLAHKPVFQAEPIVRKRFLVKDVAEFAVELSVFIEAHLHDTVLHAEGISEVITQLISRDLGRPSVQVLPIEEGNPLFLLRSGL